MLPLTSQTIEQARIIWQFFASFQRLLASDAIIVCCSYDIRVCDFACSLLQRGLAPKIIFSGANSHWTRQLWKETEAEIFFARARELGVDTNQILLETKATNIGENLRFSSALLAHAHRVLLVSKSHSLLRLQLTAEVQIPDLQFSVAGPPFQFPQDCSPVTGIFGTIHEMVGDIDRIIKYPERGYQSAYKLPQEIVRAWRYLVEQGFTQHLAPAQ